MGGVGRVDLLLQRLAIGYLATDVTYFNRNAGRSYCHGTDFRGLNRASDLRGFR